MSTQESLHPRTPAGSPDGGKFATKPGGGEAETALAVDNTPPLPRTKFHDFADENTAHESRLSAVGDQIREARKRYVEVSVDQARALAFAACPDATRVDWEWCGDTDAPTTLGTPSIACAHTEDDSFNDLYDWDETHHSNLSDLMSVMEEYDLRDYGPEYGVTENSRGEFSLNLRPASENIHVRDGASAIVRGHETVEVWGDSHVEAHDSVHVIVYGNSTADAHGDATVDARANSHVTAYDNAKVNAKANAHVDAEWSVQVSIDDQATLTRIQTIPRSEV